MRNIGGVKLQDKSNGDLAAGNGIFNGAGLAKRMISQGVRVYEVVFWDPTADKQLARTSRAPSCPSFIDVVDNYTLLLHQGLIEHSFLDEIESVSTSHSLSLPSLALLQRKVLKIDPRSVVVVSPPTSSFQQLKEESFDLTNSSPARRS